MDLPTADGASDAEREAIDAAAASLVETWPDMFKPSRSCRAPHLNVDALRDELFQARVLDAVAPGDLLPWLLARNDALAERDDAAWAASRCLAVSAAARAKALAKAREKGLFLGLTWDWLQG